MTTAAATETPTGDARCRRCGRLVGRHGVVTRAGVFCGKHADRLAPYLRRPKGKHHGA